MPDVKTSKTYTGQEIFETLTRETDFKGMFTYKPLIGGLTVCIPSHKETGEGFSDYSYHAITVCPYKSKLVIVPNNISILNRSKINQDDYPDFHSVDMIALLQRVVSECTRLFT